MDRFLCRLVLVKNRPEIMMCAKMNVLTEQDSHDDAIGQFKVPLTANWGVEGCYNSDYAISLLDVLGDIGAGPEDLLFVFLSLDGTYDTPGDGWVMSFSRSYNIILHCNSRYNVTRPGKRHLDPNELPWASASLLGISHSLRKAKIIL